MSNLKNLFSPRTIAVLGASTRPGSVGRSIFDNLRLSNFKGKIFPVNPKVKSLGGLRCYSSLTEIKHPIDLVIIVIPAVAVPGILMEMGKLKIKAAVIISAGFKEAGRIDLEDELIKIARRYRISLLGPNCLGFINPRYYLNTTFAPMMPAKGKLAFLSQSGALGTAILDKAHELSLGFSLFASVGNKAVLSEVDFLQYLQNDAQTKLLGIYAEQLSNPQRLGAAIRRFNSGRQARPVVILKSGTSLLGADASASHTGAMAGNDAVYDAFFKDNAVIRAQNMSDFFDYLQIFNGNQFVPAKNVAIITNAGGPGVLAVDAVSQNNLLLSKLADSTRSSLKRILPIAASVANPIDILGDADPKRYLSVLKKVVADKSVQSILILVTPQSMTNVEGLASDLIKWRRQNHQPLAVCLMGGNLIASAISSLRRAGIAVFAYPEQAVRALSALAYFSNRTIEKELKGQSINIKPSAKKEVDKIFDQLRRQGIKEVPEFQALTILKAYSLPVPKFLLLRSQADAARAEKHFHSPVALKIASYDILHKSEVNGVILNVRPEKLVRHYKELLVQVKKKAPRAKIEGVLVMPMATPSLAEIIIGSVEDKSLGRAFMIGWGGIYTETIKDVSFGLLPLNQNKIKRMLSELKVNSVLQGGRGQKSADFIALDKLLFTLERLLSDFPEIKEVDLNPVAVSAKEISILDARFILS